MTFENFAKSLLDTIERKEAEHEVAVRERREAHHALNILRAQGQNMDADEEQELMERVENADNGIRHDSDRPHDSVVIDALLDVLRGQ